MFFKYQLKIQKKKKYYSGGKNTINEDEIENKLLKEKLVRLKESMHIK